MTKVAIHQPNFLPWLGFFYKMSICDIFIILDNVQVSRSAAASYFSQTFIKGNNGNKILVSLPLKKCSMDTLINQVEVSATHSYFVSKLLKTLTQYYGKTPCFGKYFPGIKDILERPYPYAWELNRDLLFYCAKALNLRCEIKIASSFTTQAEKESRIIDLVKQVGGTTYISGNGAKDYQVPEHFGKEGIELVYSEFKVKPYEQLYGAFIGGLSIVDSLFNKENPLAL